MLWITGDTVLYDGVLQVADRLQVATALVHLGGVRFPISGPLRYTMTAHDAVELCSRLRPRAPSRSTTRAGPTSAKVGPPSSVSSRPRPPRSSSASTSSRWVLRSTSSSDRCGLTPPIGRPVGAVTVARSVVRAHARMSTHPSRRSRCSCRSSRAGPTTRTACGVRGTAGTPRSGRAPTGYLGDTSGVAADGRSIAIVRFESEADARANSDRPEQSAWWAETEKYLGDDVSFTESSDVTPFLGGGSDKAGFVQVMKVSGVDRARSNGSTRGSSPSPTSDPTCWVVSASGPGRTATSRRRTSPARPRHGRASRRSSPRSCRPRWPSSRRSWPRPSTSTCRTRSSVRSRAAARVRRGRTGRRRGADADEFWVAEASTPHGAARSQACCGPHDGLVAGTPDDALGRRRRALSTGSGDLLDHIAGLTVAFTEAATKSTPAGAGPPPEGDIANLDAEWRRNVPPALAELAEAWRDPAAYEGMTSAGGIEMPGEIAAIVALEELVVHGWDLARATGQDFDATPAELGVVEGFLSQFSGPDQADLRGTAYATPVGVGDDAPRLDRVVGLSGRDPGWSRSAPSLSRDGRLSRMAGSDPKADLQRYLQIARDAVLWKLDGLSEYDIRRPMVPTGTNLLGPREAPGQRGAGLLRRHLRPAVGRAAAVVRGGCRAERRHVGNPRGVAPADRGPVPPDLGALRRHDRRLGARRHGPRAVVAGRAQRGHAAPDPDPHDRRDEPARRPGRPRPRADRRSRRPVGEQRQPAGRRPVVVGDLPGPVGAGREGRSRPDRSRPRRLSPRSDPLPGSGPRCDLGTARRRPAA